MTQPNSSDTGDPWRGTQWEGTERPWLQDRTPTGAASPMAATAPPFTAPADARQTPDPASGSPSGSGGAAASAPATPGAPAEARGPAGGPAVVVATAVATIVLGGWCGRAYAAALQGGRRLGPALPLHGGAAAWTAAWIIVALVGAVAWALVVGRRPGAARPRSLAGGRSWAGVIGVAAPVLSVLACVAVMVPSLDGLPG